MNTIILNTPRGNVTKRFRYIYPFYLSLRAPINTPRLPLDEFAITSN